MKKSMCKGILLLAVLCLLAACSPDRSGKDRVVAKINDYDLTVEEFEYQLGEQAKMAGNRVWTEEGRKAFLEDLIEKELLIQEARRLALDRREAFIRCIERYWESMLVRDLLEIRAEEMKSKVVVTAAEVEARYRENLKQGGEYPPIEDVRKDITETLKQKRMADSMRKWIDSLRKNATIEIDRPLAAGK